MIMSENQFLPSSIIFQLALSNKIKVVSRISKRKWTKTVIVKSLVNISTSCAWTEGHWPDCGYAWNEIEDTPRVQRSLRDQLLKLDSQYNLNK